ncbi:MAG TPA: glycine zipper family protein [Methylococcaceae bacterium]|nr:glycine zipper family protein [Methylococcaceae bacterium]
MTRCAVPILSGLVALGFLSGPVAAQEPFVYPAQGQSAQKTAADKAACQGWATQQTGVDPLRLAASAPPAAGTQQGQVLRGGAKGAAAGAVIGAIAGDAGKGAAIGAASGGVLGAARKRHDRRAAEQAQAQQAQAQSQQLDSFFRAYGACLQGRGYTVN